MAELVAPAVVFHVLRLANTEPYTDDCCQHVRTIYYFVFRKPGNNTFINQLRWTHMGYHFDYNIVDYKAKQYFGFPTDLAQLTETIAGVFQFKNYIAETGIINYYPEGSSMGGHTDHYEEALRQPLISYSFGQTAVYLIGGDTRDIKPEGECHNKSIASQ